jgi:succinate dehydrogenase/fumarate reductase cytochrome b subunit
MKKLWFKAKRYGWGWYPSTWQGWSVILLFIIAEIILFHNIDSHQHSVSDTLINFIPATFVLAIIVIAICYIKGEKPGWHWGN